MYFNILKNGLKCVSLTMFTLIMSVKDEHKIVCLLIKYHAMKTCAGVHNRFIMLALGTVSKKPFAHIR